MIWAGSHWIQLLLATSSLNVAVSIMSDVAPEKDCRCWAAQGQCSANRKYMERKCAASCAWHHERERAIVGNCSQTLQACIADVEALARNSTVQASIESHRVVELEDMLQVLNAQLETSARNISTMSLQITDFQAQAQQLQEAADIAASKEQSLANQNLNLQARVEALEFQLKSAGSQQLLKENQNASVLNCQASHLPEDMKSIAAVGEVPETHKARIAELEARVQLLQKVADSASAAESSARDEIGTLEARIYELESKLSGPTTGPSSSTETDSWHQLYEMIFRFPSDMLQLAENSPTYINHVVADASLKLKTLSMELKSLSKQNSIVYYQVISAFAEDCYAVGEQQLREAIASARHMMAVISSGNRTAWKEVLEEPIDFGFGALISMCVCSFLIICTGFFRSCKFLIAKLHTRTGVLRQEVAVPIKADMDTLAVNRLRRRSFQEEHTLRALQAFKETSRKSQQAMKTPPPSSKAKKRPPPLIFDNIDLDGESGTDVCASAVGEVWTSELDEPYKVCSCRITTSFIVLLCAATMCCYGSKAGTSVSSTHVSHYWIRASEIANSCVSNFANVWELTREASAGMFVKVSSRLHNACPSFDYLGVAIITPLLTTRSTWYMASAVSVAVMLVIFIYVSRCQKSSKADLPKGVSDPVTGMTEFLAQVQEFPAGRSLHTSSTFTKDMIPQHALACRQTSSSHQGAITCVSAPENIFPDVEGTSTSAHFVMRDQYHRDSVSEKAPTAKQGCRKCFDLMDGKFEQEISADRVQHSHGVIRDIALANHSEALEDNVGFRKEQLSENMPECPETECPESESATTECPSTRCPSTECPTVESFLTESAAAECFANEILTTECSAAACPAFGMSRDDDKPQVLEVSSMRWNYGMWFVGLACLVFVAIVIKFFNPVISDLFGFDVHHGITHYCVARIAEYMNALKQYLTTATQRVRQGGTMVASTQPRLEFVILEAITSAIISTVVEACFDARFQAVLGCVGICLLVRSVKPLIVELQTRHGASCEILDLDVPPARCEHFIRVLAGLTCSGSVVCSLVLHGPSWMANAMQCERYGCPGLQVVDDLVLANAHVHSVLLALSAPLVGSIAHFRNFVGFVSALPFSEQAHVLADNVKSIAIPAAFHLHGEPSARVALASCAVIVLLVGMHRLRLFLSAKNRPLGIIQC
jgi:hypothetical protein